MQLPGVRDVHPQQRMTRALAWDGDGDGGAGGCGLCEVGEAGQRGVQKRPGRSRTSPPFCFRLQISQDCHVTSLLDWQCLCDPSRHHLKV